MPVLAFTTGGIVYPTLFLVCWVALAGTGEATLAIMLPPSVLSSWVTWRTWSLIGSTTGAPDYSHRTISGTLIVSSVSSAGFAVASKAGSEPLRTCTNQTP